MVKFRTKKYNKIIICFILCITMVTLNTASAMAQQTIKNSYEYDYNDFWSNDNTEDFNSAAVFHELSDDAKEIFLNYMITKDRALLEYHKNYVDPMSALVYQPMNTVLYSTDAMYGLNSTAAALDILSYRLDLIGLSESVKYALMGVGSSIMAALADGPLLVGDIVAFLVAAGCATVLIANWGTISRNWSDITAAFEVAFNTLISSTTISSSFTQSKPSYENPYNEMMAVRSQVHYAQVNKTAARHIDMAFVQSLVRNNSALRVYVSHSRQSALLVYRTNTSTRANVNIDFAHRNSENTGTYQNMNYLIPSGVYVFILYDLRSRNVFHAHIRFNQDDTEQMRYANRLSWTVYPFFIYEPKYEIGGSAFLNGTIFN